MTQEYKILWFEDSKDFVGSLIDSIKTHVENMGFQFSYEVKPDDKELDEEFLKKMDPDLIIVDYGLGSGTKGDIVVSKIRAIEPSADVVFYSGKIEDYINKISRNIDGVFFTIRENLLERTQKLIDRSVRKQQEPNNMRGVIIAEAVDIEGKMENLILIALGVDTERKKVIEKILNPEFQVLTFQKKYDLVNKICKERIKNLKLKKGGNPTEKVAIEKTITAITEKKEVFVTAQTEVIEMRNIMAHASFDPVKGCLVSYVRSEPVVVNDDFCKKTRQDLLKHSENLDELASLIATEI
jgi:hypothetical protein